MRGRDCALSYIFSLCKLAFRCHKWHLALLICRGGVPFVKAVWTLTSPLTGSHRQMWFKRQKTAEKKQQLDTCLIQSSAILNSFETSHEWITIVAIKVPTEATHLTI